MISAAAFDTIDWRGTAERVLSDTPAWALAAAGGAVLVAALIVGFLTWNRASKRRAAQEERHQEALLLAREEGQPLPDERPQMDYKPLLGGIAVSLHGLWGFATQTAELSFFFAIGFVSMFDILQLRLFSQMFKTADPRKGWTRSMRVMRATTWGFVLLSAVANFQHAPNIWSAPWLAAMPIGAAWVIQIPLKDALDNPDQEEEKRPEGVKPGPFRLVALLWRRIWAWFFRWFGLDVNDRADEMVRRALARDAADASYALRNVLLEKQELEAVVARATTPVDDDQPPVPRSQLQQAQKRLAGLTKDLEKKVRPRAQQALELAETQDSDQGLQLMQRMAWLTRADDVALLDYGPNSTAMELLEELNIAANADFIKSRKRAVEAEETRREAQQAVREAKEKLAAVEEELEKNRTEAETARQEAEEIRQKAEVAKQEATTAREAEEKRLQSLRDERAMLESSDATSAQLYQRTTQELDDLRNQLGGLQEERGKLTDAYNRVQRQAQEASEKALRLEGEQETLTIQLQNLQTERTRYETEASDSKQEALEARQAADEAQKQLVRLESKLSALETVQRPVPARAPGGPRVQANLDEDQKATREQIREVLEELTPEQRELSQRELAVLIEPRVAVKADSIRRHLRAIAREDQPDVPGQRPADDEDDDDE
ncbi:MULTISPECIES: hypothetical protein [Streptomyces]|uniref:hypothetical protein n=1 Tax=Streptomyces TaxID=1883 RepID=UPI000BEF9118|nr:hypothetical protein [Streptomyces sp. wa1063]